jgi:chromosome segregation ATPase
MNRPKQHDAGRPVIMAILLTTLLAVTLATGGCGKQMARMEDNQVKLQAMVMANARQLATVSSQVHTGQSELNRTLAKIDEKADGINSEVLTVQNTQTQLRETMVNGNRQINRKIAQLESNQAFLKDGVAQVANIAQNTNVAVGAVAKDQATLHRMVQSHKLELDDSIAAVAKSQQRTHTGIDQLQAADRSLAGQISGVADQQDVLQRLAQDNTQQLVGHLTTLGTEQTAMHNSLKNGTQTLADKLAILEHTQLDIQSVIDRVANTTNTTADDITNLAATQSEMQQTQGVRYENLTGQLATAAQNQRSLQAGIGTLDAKADRTTSQLTTLAAGQSTIQETVHANNASVAAGLTHVCDNQETLRDNLQRLDDHSQSLAADLGKAITNQATTQDTLAKSNEAFATFSENQIALQHHVSDLNGKADVMASHISSVSTELGTVHETVKTGNELATAQATALAEGQHSLKTDLGQLTEQTHQLAAGQTTLSQTMQSHADAASGQMTDMANDQRTIRDHVDAVMTTASQLALNVVAMSNRQAQFEQEVQTGIANLDQGTNRLAAGQNALNESLQAHDESVAGSMTNLANTQGRIQGELDTVAATTTQVALDIITLDDNQAKLGVAAQTDREKLNARLTDVAQNQQQTQSGLDTLTATTTQVALDIITLDDNQAKLGVAAQTDREKLNARLTDVAQNQQQTQSGLDALTATTTQVALDIITLDDNQAKLGVAAQTDRENFNARLTDVAQNQQQTQSGLDTLTATTTQVALDIITLDDNQAKLGVAAQTDRDNLNARLTDVAQNQQQTQSGLDTLTATTTQVALDIITLDDNQAKLGVTAQTDRENLNARLTDVAQNQQQTQSGLDTLTATTTQVALDVITLDNNQTEQGKNLQANYQEVVSQLTAAAQGQQYMQGNLDIITATTTQVGLDVIALDDKQGKIGQTLQAGQQQFGPRLTQLAENQQQIDTALDTLTSTTTQVALDVIALDDNQAKQGKNLLATQQAFTAQIDTVTQGQQELQSNLDTVTATTSQVALDVITLDDNQGRIEQAVETNRQQLATRLTEIAQGQQQWLARFDAAEAKVDTMTASITAFEQRVAKLQGTLQTSLENLSTLLDTESQQRVQFQDSVRQDMQSVTDSIAQLREIQAGLAGHIRRVQDSTQSQNSDILSALEQLQQKTDADAANVDTELKSSKAAPQEIMLP